MFVAWQNTAQEVVLAGAVVGAVALIWSKVLHPMLRFANRLDAAITRVEHELGNNGGGTLRDRVDCIKDETERIAVQANLQHQLLEQRLAALESHLMPKPAAKPRTRTRKPQP